MCGAWRPARDLCAVQATCRTLRGLGRRNGLWRPLFVRAAGPGSARVSSAALEAGTREDDEYWWKRCRRHSRGEALIRVLTFSGRCVEVAVLATDDKCVAVPACQGIALYIMYLRAIVATCTSGMP